MYSASCLKNLANPLFVKRLFHSNTRENIKAAYYWPFVKEILQWPRMTNDAINIYLPKRHDDLRSSRYNIHLPKPTSLLVLTSASTFSMETQLYPIIG